MSQKLLLLTAMKFGRNIDALHQVNYNHFGVHLMFDLAT